MIYFASIHHSLLLASAMRACTLHSQEESGDYITFDNLDAKIQKAVENEVNLDFALTPAGNKIVYRRS